MRFHRLDVNGKMQFAPLNGSTYQQKVLAHQNRPIASKYPSGSLFLFYNRQWFAGYDAIKAGLAIIDWPWKWIFKLIPNDLGRLAYNLIAANRHRLASKQCAIPPSSFLAVLLT